MEAGKTGIWVLRERALSLGEHLVRGLDAVLYGPGAGEHVHGRAAFSGVYSEYHRWVLIMTTGIAVRYLKDLLQSKHEDPGVVVVDEAARQAVSLVGGHEGGANRLAYEVSRLTGATPVITTASEVGRDLVVGIGCRRGVSGEQIDKAIKGALAESGDGVEAVREVATIDVKAHEPALLRWCEDHGVGLRVFNRQQLRDRPWVSEPSGWVQQTIGVPGVCEPAALLASPRGRLVVTKRTRDGTAVAVVRDRPIWEECG